MSPFFRLLTEQEEEQEQPKFTKEQAGFEESPPVYRCGACRQFIPDEKKCHIVSELGGDDPVIVEGNGCKLWNAGPIRQRMRERRFGRGLPQQSSSQ